MGFDLSELDAQLAALGGVRADALQIARILAGDTRSLAAVDQALAELGNAVKLAAPPAVRVGSPASQPKPQGTPPRAPSPAAAVPQAAAKPPASVPAPAPDSEPPAAPVQRGAAPPQSAEIALPEPVQHEASPRSGELALDAPAPRSGSFALDVPADDTSLDEDTDSDFEAEFAALSGADTQAGKPQPDKPRSIRPQASSRSPKPISIAPKPVSEPPPPLSVSADDEETDAVLALFDAAANAPESPSRAPSAPLSFGGLSAELEPSVAPPASNSPRDPDAEFDALFDEASNPSSMPVGPSADSGQDSVDDLLRDLGAPRVPKDLAVSAAVRNASRPVDDELGEDPTGIFDSSVFDAITGGPEKSRAKPAQAAPADDDFEIDMDMDELTDDEVQAAPKHKPKPAPPKMPPQPPLPPGGVEKRPSFLGRLFGGPGKDPESK